MMADLVRTLVAETDLSTSYWPGPADFSIFVYLETFEKVIFLVS